MKNKNLIYWIVTGLFSGFMVFSAYPDVILDPQAVEMIGNQMGYPDYFIRFIGIAKILGVIAVLLSINRRIKEWAYAGLFFDLFGAVVSIIATEGVSGGVFFMMLPIGFLFWSYYLWHQKIKTA